MKGKKLGKKRVLTSLPKRAFMAWSRVPLRSEKVMLVSTAEAFDLVEDGGVSGVSGIVAVDLAGDDDADGRGLGDHRADLDRAGVGAHEEAVA